MWYLWGTYDNKKRKVSPNHNHFVHNLFASCKVATYNSFYIILWTTSRLYLRWNMRNESWNKVYKIKVSIFSTLLFSALQLSITLKHNILIAPLIPSNNTDELRLNHQRSPTATKKKAFRKKSPRARNCAGGPARAPFAYLLHT